MYSPAMRSNSLSGTLTPSHATQRQPQPKKSRKKKSRAGYLSLTRLPSKKDFMLGLLYGLINSILNIPCMYGYAQIIFSAKFFGPHRPALSKLVLFSSAVHQVLFTLFSTLPFAIGQVQDAGLIFLSAMATSLVTAGAAAGWDEDTTLATVVVGLSISTASLGVMLVIIGKLKLASLVSYLPAPVVGGYLAFIGYFCLIAGLDLCAPAVVFTGRLGEDLGAYHTLFTSPDMLLLCVPALLGGALMLIISHKFTHFLALPGVIMAMPVAFFLVLICTGTSLDEARAAGWADVPPANTSSFQDAFAGFQFDKVQWDTLPSLLPTWLAMVFVVSFSSGLDVAAIEMDMGHQLDINHELTTVGLSNLASGLLGGFTGSYIFSQTIFTFRTGVHTRVVGVVVTILELAVFFAPVSVTSLLPRFFFASTLIFIAFDLLIEWLVLVRHKLLLREYIVLLVSFVLINVLGLEVGMGAALGVALLHFVLSYSRAWQKTVAVVTRQSNTLTFAEERERIEEAHREIVALELRGFLFFGSAVAIVEQVKKKVLVDTRAERAAAETDTEADAHTSANAHDKAGRQKREDAVDTTHQALLDPLSSSADDAAGGATGHRRGRSTSENGMSYVAHRTQHRAPASVDGVVDTTRGNISAAPARVGALQHEASVSASASRGLLSPLLGRPRPATPETSPSFSMTIDRIPSRGNGVSSNDVRKRRTTTSEPRICSLFELEQRAKNKKRAGTQNKTAAQSSEKKKRQKKGRRATKVLILDFHHVVGMDATAVRSCFLVLNSVLGRHGIKILISGASKDVIFLLSKNGLAEWQPGRLACLDDALLEAEDTVLAGSRHLKASLVAVDDPVRIAAFVAALPRPKMHHGDRSLSPKSLRRRSAWETPSSDDHDDTDDAAAGGGSSSNGRQGHGGALLASLIKMARYGARTTDAEAALLLRIEPWFDVTRPLEKGEVLFGAGDASEALFVVRTGQIVVTAEDDEEEEAQSTRGSNPRAAQTRRKASASVDMMSRNMNRPERMLVKQGFVLGESDFFLEQPRHFTAAAQTDGTTLWRLTRDSVKRMTAANPTMRHILDKFFVRILSRQVSWAQRF